jgi:hypothetical protein
MASNALAYLEDYLDTFEALPIEVTKQMTLLKELGNWTEFHIFILQFLDSKCKFLKFMNSKMM